MHKREAVLLAVYNKLVAYAGLAGVTIRLDSSYDIADGVLRAVDVEQGGEDVLQYIGAAYLDCQLSFSIRLHAKVSENVRTTTLLNDLHSQIIKALTPGVINTLGVAGASNLSENGSSEPIINDGTVPSGEMVTSWTIQYRRDVDDPENLT